MPPAQGWLGVLVGCGLLMLRELFRQDHAVADQAGTVGSQQEQPGISAGGNSPGHAPRLQMEAGNGYLLNNSRVIPLVPAGRVPAQDDGAHGPIVPAGWPVQRQEGPGQQTARSLSWGN